VGFVEFRMKRTLKSRARDRTALAPMINGKASPLERGEGVKNAGLCLTPERRR